MPIHEYNIRVGRYKNLIYVSVKRIDLVSLPKQRERETTSHIKFNSRIHFYLFDTHCYHRFPLSHIY